MATIAELIVKIAADTSALTRNLNKARTDVSSFGRIVTGASPASFALAGALGTVATAAAGVGLKAVQMAADMEQSKVAFTTLLGSAKQADSFLKEMRSFAARTPFEFKGLQDSARQLLAFGFSAKQILPMMTAVGDAVSALGGGEFEIQRVVRALGQMQAKGKVSAEEMMQLAELGIPAWELLANAIGTSVPKAMKKAEKGAIPASMAIQGIVSGMEERFKGSMANQSKTLQGLWSTAKDNVSIILTDLGTKIVETFDLNNKLASAIEWLTKFSQEITKVIDVVSKEGAGAAFEKLVPPDLKLKIIAVAGAIAGALVPAIWSFASGVIAATVPLLPFIAAGAAIAALAYLVYSHWKDKKKFFAEVGERIAAGIKSIIDRFRQLPTTIVSFLSELPGKIAYWIGYALGTIVRLAIEWGPKIWDFYINFPGKVAGFLAKLWPSIRDHVTEALLNFYNVVKNKVEDAIEFFKELPGKIASYLRNLPGEMLKKALDIGDKFWSGLKKGLGIHSPSYVEIAFLNIRKTALDSVNAVRSAVSNINSNIVSLRPANLAVSLGGAYSGSVSSRQERGSIVINNYQTISNPADALIISRELAWQLSTRGY